MGVTHLHAHTHTPDCVVLNHWNQASRRTNARSRKEDMSLLSMAENLFLFKPETRSVWNKSFPLLRFMPAFHPDSIWIYLATKWTEEYIIETQTVDNLNPTCGKQLEMN